MSDHVIECERLTRAFGGRVVVDDLTLAIPRGCVTAFLGRNGSGKTTTLRMILGLIDPTRGRSSLLGHDSRRIPPEVRARVGYMTEGHALHAWMRKSQLEDFQSRFFPRWNRKLFEAVTSHFRIDAKTKAGHLSRGQRAGLSLALTLAPEPELLILDDPALGLDPFARRSLLEAMIYYTRRQERTILFSSHILADVERAADHIAILDLSVLRACCPLESFRGKVRDLVLHFPGAPPPTPTIPGLLRALRFDRELRLSMANLGDRAAQIATQLGAASFEEHELTLEEQILAYMGDRGEQSYLFETLSEAT